MGIQEILKKPALQAAPLLLGCEIVRNTPAGQLRLKIVETEAYHQNDPASHTFRGLTKRTAPMFEAGGHLYVYFTYGMHYCLNIVTGRKGVGEAVLLRAGEPIDGADLMWNNRFGEKAQLSYLDAVQGSHEERAKRTQTYAERVTEAADAAMRQKPAGVSGSAGQAVGKAVRELSNGPGKLAQALGIFDTSLSGQKLDKNSLQLVATKIAIPTDEIISSPRIGIRQATDMPWRFYLKGNKFVSKYQKAVHN